MEKHRKPGFGGCHGYPFLLRICVKQLIFCGHETSRHSVRKYEFFGRQFNDLVGVSCHARLIGNEPLDTTSWGVLVVEDGAIASPLKVVHAKFRSMWIVVSPRSIGAKLKHVASVGQPCPDKSRAVRDRQSGKGRLRFFVCAMQEEERSGITVTTEMVKKVRLVVIWESADASRVFVG